MYGSGSLFYVSICNLLSTIDAVKRKKNSFFSCRWRLFEIEEVIAKTHCVALTFEFWMSYVSKDLFSVVYHTLTDYFEEAMFSIGLISMDNTSGELIATELDTTM